MSWDYRNMVGGQESSHSPAQTYADCTGRQQGQAGELSIVQPVQKCHEARLRADRKLLCQIARVRIVLDRREQLIIPATAD